MVVCDKSQDVVGGSRAVADHQCVYLLLLLLLLLVQAQYNILRLLSEVIKGLPPPTPLKQQGKVGRTHPVCGGVAIGLTVWWCGDTDQQRNPEPSQRTSFFHTAAEPETFSG